MLVNYNYNMNRMHNIGKFFFSDPEICKNSIAQSRKRIFNSLLYNLLKKPHQENFLKSLKEYLSDGAEIIGPRYAGLEFCEENIGKFFIGEKKWPVGAQALIYLQMYIQTTRNTLNQNAAKILLTKCLSGTFENNDWQNPYAAGFLGKIFNLCAEQNLIKFEFSKVANNSMEDKPNDKKAEKSKCSIF